MPHGLLSMLYTTYTTINLLKYTISLNSVSEELSNYLGTRIEILKDWVLKSKWSIVEISLIRFFTALLTESNERES